MKYFSFFLLFILCSESLAQSFNLKNDTIFLDNESIGITKKVGKKTVGIFKNNDQMISYRSLLMSISDVTKLEYDKYVLEKPLDFNFQTSEIYENDLSIATFEFVIRKDQRRMKVIIKQQNVNKDFLRYCVEKKSGLNAEISYDLTTNIASSQSDLFKDSPSVEGHNSINNQVLRLTEAGFNKRAQKKIIIRYGGNVQTAFEAWSQSGSTLLNKGSAESAKKLGLDVEFVDKALRDAKRVRASVMAAAAQGVSSGLNQVASDMEGRSQSQNESNAAQSAAFGGGAYDLTSGGSLSVPKGSTEADVWRNTAQKFKTSSSQIQTPTVNQIPNSTVATSNSVDNFQSTSMSGSLPTVNGESEIYAIDQNGMQQKAGTLKNNNMGGVDLYEKGEFGIDERTATYKENNMGGVDKYEKGEFGIDERTATYKENNMGGVDKYEKGEYGIDKKTEVYRTNNRGELEVYLVDKNGSETLDMIYRASIHGGYDVYEIDINGMEKLTGRVVDLPRY